MQVSVRIKGLAELKKKLTGSILVQPEMEAAIETVGARLERKGKGLGEQRNAVARSTSSLALPGSSIAQIVTFDVTHYPRVTGSAKTRKSIAIFRAMAPRVVRSAAAKIAARWAA